MLDIGTFSRDKPLSQEHIAARQELFSQYQKEYNESHDKNILWLKMGPLIKDAVEASVMKINHNVYILNYNEKVETAYFSLMKRYTNNPDYNYGSLSTLAYYAALYSSRNKNIQEKDKIGKITRISYESYIESTGNEISYEQDFESFVDLEELY